MAIDPQTTDPRELVERAEEPEQFRSEVIARLVVVACEVVARRAVKFWRVVEPESNRFESEVSPPVAVNVVPTATEPVKLAADDIVWPLMRPEVMVPAVKLLIVPLVEKRFVLDAEVEKRAVVVAEVIVAEPAKSVVVVAWVVVDLSNIAPPVTSSFVAVPVVAVEPMTTAVAELG